jgi:serine/threonine protein kinase
MNLMEDLTGKQLGQYQIIVPIGEGGMAAVYKAYQPSIERYVALKILSRHYAAEPNFTQRFKQEARIIASLAWDDAARQLFFWTVRGSPHIVYDEIQLVDRSGAVTATYTVPQTVEYPQQVAWDGLYLWVLHT